jgi:hypothetical protein
MGKKEALENYENYFFKRYGVPPKSLTIKIKKRPPNVK